MSFEEEFDKIIRRKAEEEKYPFDESNWEKTSKLLDADRKAARALKIKQLYLPAALCVALGSIGLLTFNYLNNENGQGTTQLTKSLSQTPSVINPDNSSAQKETANKESKNLFEANKVNVASRQASEISMSKVSPMAKDSNPQNVKESSSGIESTEQVKEISMAGNSAPQPVAFSNPANQEQDPEVVKTDEPNQNVQDQVAVNPVGVEKNKEEIVAPPAAENLITEAESLQIEKLNAVYSALPYEIADSEVVLSPFTFLNRYDDDYYKAVKIAKKHYLNAELGANYLFGWDTKEGKDGVGFNWFGGFNYGRYLTRKMSISIGLQAYNIANINQPFYLASGKEYGFGSTSTYTRVTSHELYYASVPLKFNYALNPSNTIGLGANVGYLFNAKNSVSSYYILDTEEKVVAPTSKTTGIYEGTNLTNVILSAHYKTQLTNRIALNAEFNYGLTDVFKNMGTIKNNEAPVGIRFSLQYTLFDK